MPALPEAQCLHLTLICLDKSYVIASPVFKTGAAIAQISKVCFYLISTCILLLDDFISLLDETTAIPHEYAF